MAAAEIALLAIAVRRLQQAERRAGLLDRILASELAIFRYAFGWRRTPEVPSGAHAFPVHRQSGVAMLFGFLAGVSVMEAGLVHLVVSRWSPRAAWVLTALSVYGAIWLVAVARSFALRPVVLDGEDLTLRAGLLWAVRVPVRSLTVDYPGAACDLRMPPMAEPNVVFRLSEPAVAYGMFGMTRRVLVVGIAVDDPDELRRQVQASAASGSCSNRL